MRIVKRHKCNACGKTRLVKYMTGDVMWVSKSGKDMAKWICGDCEEENRGRMRKYTKDNVNGNSPT